MKIVVTFGTFDLFHVGHLRILKRAKDYGGTLIVGISSDLLNLSKKNKFPIYSEIERMEIVLGTKYVDSVFIEDSLDLKVEYLKKFKADILIMGDDWKGKFDYCKDKIPGLEVIYLPRTESISTTMTIEKINLSK